MSETSNQLDIATAVAVYPKPMAEGGGFWRGWRETGVMIGDISHQQLSRKWRCFSLYIPSWLRASDFDAAFFIFFGKGI